MPEQINLISFIDQKVKDIISSGGNEISVMISLLDEMPRVKAIIDSADKEAQGSMTDKGTGGAS